MILLKKFFQKNKTPNFTNNAIFFRRCYWEILSTRSASTHKERIKKYRQIRDWGKKIETVAIPDGR